VDEGSFLMSEGEKRQIAEGAKGKARAAMADLELRMG
jgi:hypothetical protein